ncbi:MAG: tyrosine-type recombinase/integrase [Gammaproteobacteria bacterium]
MLSTYFTSKRTCERYYQGPAGDYLDDFAEWLAERGYKHATIRRRIIGAGQFAQWGQSRFSSIAELNTDALRAFSRSLARKSRLRNARGHYQACFRGARSFVHFLQARGIVAVGEAEPPQAYPQLFCAFQSWMLAHAGVTRSTVDGYRAIVLDLLLRVGEAPEQYTAKALRDFVLYRVRHHNRASAQNVVSAMRMLLRFLVVTGRLEPGLEGAIPNVAAWRLRTLPRSLPTEEIERVIAACDASTTLGARDHAIILLLARLGLRAGEVAALRIDDVDWHGASMQIRDKCRRKMRLPLPQTVGDALLHYLEQFRPPLEVEQIFITTVAPYRSLRRVTVSQIATRALRRAGVATPVFGAHLFRHSVATSLLNQGASLQTIALVLRHASLESTQLYAKVDQRLLHEVTLPWPEVVPC